MISRRTVLAAALGAPAVTLSPAPAAQLAGRLQREAANLERTHGGRLGVAILDAAIGTPVAYRGGERFALCSTFKCLAAAYVLARVDRGQESLARRVVFARDQLVPNSPTTGTHVGGRGMRLSDICEAAITLSDNTAGNLMLDSFGGPAGLTAWLRSLGDPITRLDRRETALNEAAPDDPRDTTTPLAMLGLVGKFVLGSTLSVSSRAQLNAWLIANKTGDKRLRAGMPAGWLVGDKTGSARRNANDIAVAWRPAREPIIVTAYYADTSASDDERNLVLAQIGRLAAV